MGRILGDDEIGKNMRAAWEAKKTAVLCALQISRSSYVDLSTANHTLNLLGGIDGLKYANVITGGCDRMGFLRFFEEASECVDPVTRRPIIEVDDIIVVDNLAAHHGEVKRALRQYFYELGVELLFLPVYSPDMNPVEEVFAKLKYLLKYKYNNIVFDNLEYAIWLALGDITPGDMYGYYKHLCYL